METTWLHGVYIRDFFSTPCFRANLLTKCDGISSYTWRRTCSFDFGWDWRGLRFFLCFHTLIRQCELPRSSLYFDFLEDACELEKMRRIFVQHQGGFCEHTELFEPNRTKVVGKMRGGRVLDHLRNNRDIEENEIQKSSNPRRSNSLNLESRQPKWPRTSHLIDSLEYLVGSDVDLLTAEGIE